MWRAKTIAPVMLAGATLTAFFAIPRDLPANWRWGSCLCGCGDGRTRQEWAADAAALGVKGGAPALGFCRSVTGYEQGIIRIPYPAAGSADINAANLPAVSSTATGNVPPPPAPNSPSAQPGSPQVPPVPMGSGLHSN
jgi:hypothetical protein